MDVVAGQDLERAQGFLLLSCRLKEENSHSSDALKYMQVILKFGDKN